MNNEEKIYLTIDSRLINDTPQDLIVYFKNEIKHRKIYLKNIDVQANKLRSSDRRLYVHCSILNKDDNLMNGEKSDIIAILYKYRSTGFKIGNTGPKLIIPHSNSIRLYLTDDSDMIIEPFSANLSIVYELEFLN